MDGNVLTERIKRIKKSKYRTILHIAACLLLSLLTEVFVFNLRFFQTLRSKPVEAQFEVTGSLSKSSDGIYISSGGDCDIVINSDFLEGIENGRIKHIFLKISDVSQDETWGRRKDFRVIMYATDTSHVAEYMMGERQIYDDEERSNYLSIYPYGECRSLRIHSSLDQNREYSIKIVLNPKFPFIFGVERVIVLFLILVSVYLLRPKGLLHRYTYLKWDKRFKLGFIIAFIIINAVFLYWMVNLNPMYQDEPYENSQQYQKLAEAFSRGSLSILIDPDPALVAMENPYDYDARVEVLEKAGQTYRFDHAYYNGKYYVYFGAVPVVLVYLPYYVLTGEHIHNYTVVYIGLMFFIISTLVLMDEIIRRYYKKCSVGIYYMFLQFLILGSNMIYISKRPDFYSVPNVFGVSFGLLGMWAYHRFDRIYGEENGKTSKSAVAFLVAGSLCTALICGCRPQIFLFFVLDLIILKKHFKDYKLYVAFLAPYVVIAAVIMWYNAARFGSPFDFGANYNLTFNDMRFRGFHFDRLPAGLFTYLFHPLVTIYEYPYFYGVLASTQYLGVTIQETTYGGIVFASPFCVIGLIPLIFRKYFKKNELWFLTLASLIVVIVIASVDTEMSGILQRYYADFATFAMLGGVFASIMIYKNKNVRKTGFQAVFTMALVGLLVFEYIYHINVFMLDMGDYARNERKDLFYHVYYLLGFYL